MRIPLERSSQSALAVQLLDKLDVLECFEDANHSLRIGEMLNKQAEIYEALGVDVPTSSC